MAIVHESFTIQTTPTLIAEIPEGNPATEVQICNHENHAIFVGDATVAISGVDKGLNIIKDSVYVITLNAEDKLYAIAATTSPANAVTILYSKVV
jgi:rRNA processing protein Krr1/Pno1